jgi:hypothetical protein
MNDFTPPADPWPPPEPPPGPAPSRHWLFLPVLGWIIWAILDHRRMVPHRAILDRIESQILLQLKDRPSRSPWPEGSPHRELARLLEKAAAAEKGLKHVTVYPDDPVAPLLWGPFDDLSPFFVATGLERMLGIRMSQHDLITFFERRFTVDQWLDWCLARSGHPDSPAKPSDPTGTRP